MSESLERAPLAELSEQMARLEDRIAHLERLFNGGLAPKPGGSTTERHAAGQPGAPSSPMDETDKARRAEEFEFEVGQNWFAKVGIVALAVGVAFALSLPFDNLPAGVPSVAGYCAVAILFLLAHLWRNSFDLVSRYFRGAAMALLYIATLRLYFFGKQHVLAIHSITGECLLVFIVALNLIIAYRRKSPYLFCLALALGYVTAAAVNAPGFLFIGIAVLSGLAVYARVKFDWPGVLLLGTGLTYLTYLNWAANNPFFSHRYQLLNEPASSVFVLLGCIGILAAGSILRKERAQEDPATILITLVNCTLGYTVFFGHTLAFPAMFSAAHLIASIVLIGLAVVFWVRERSKAGTFIYAMTGYMALSIAIIKASGVPEVFVWLALQSVVVVTTAIWFQSRFIVLANFLIYVAIVAAYVIVAKRESGISLVLGVVALVSARILNWQKERLLLKTELMRNAYLFSGFAIFPYALFHLVPGAYVALAWVGAALFYYLMNLIVRSIKYRWMGHATLLLTAVYLAVVGTSRFEPLYRILSFFALGTVLLLVSLHFTKVRNRARRAEPSNAATPRPAEIPEVIDDDGLSRTATARIEVPGEGPVTVTRANDG